MKKIDLVGQRFGRLVVVGPLPAKKKRTMWSCRCDCGADKAINGHDLVAGKTRSCGCLAEENRRSMGQRCSGMAGKITGRKNGRRRRKFAVATLLAEHRHHCGNARARGLTPLSFDAWHAIVVLPCHYCGGIERRITSYAKRVGNAEDAVEIVGVDRLDSTRGYELGNIVPCCGLCNRMKLDMTRERFLAQVSAIAARFGHAA